MKDWTELAKEIFPIEYAEFCSVSDNRHPEVRIGVTIEEDVKRRDFTINALFYNIAEQRIIDLVGGVSDLEAGIVRCVGRPEDRFAEDHLRRLRAVRFAARLGFTIHDDTMDAILANPFLEINREAIVKEFLEGYSKARTKYEYFLLLVHTGLIYEILPDVTLQVFLMNPKVRPDWTDVRLELYLADLLSDHEGKDGVFKASKYLVEKCGFETRLSKGVEFLLKLSAYAGRDIDLNPNDFLKLRSGCDLTDEDILIYNNKAAHAVALLEWKPDDNQAASLMDQGVKGAELGKALREIHVQSYKDILNRIQNEQTTPQSKTSQHRN